MEIKKQRNKETEKQRNRKKFFGLSEARGAAALLSVFLFLSVSLVLGGGFLMFSLSEVRASRNYVKSIESYYTAEGGLEDLIYRVKNLKKYSASETLTIDNSILTMNVVNVGNKKQITVRGNVGDIIRKVAAFTQISTTDVDFHYGVQVGAGGAELKSNSVIQGNIYSNGSVKGGVNSSVNGDLYVAGINSVEQLKIDGDLHANNIKISEIKGDAYYQTIDNNSLNWLNNYAPSPGVAYPNSDNPEIIDMPISADAINSWKQAAQAGGTYDGLCPYLPADGATVGPLKINCDMEIEGGKSITIAGPLWVNGDIKIGNNVVLVLDPSFGDLSGVVIADYPENTIQKGKIVVENNAFVCGSAGYNDDTDHCNLSNGSYLMLLSTFSDAQNDAIDISNNVEGAIFYASNGSALIRNNVNIKEVIAYKLKLDNNAVVAYESGLANARFSSGPGASWKVSGWREVE